jgi:hemolysin D
MHSDIHLKSPTLHFTAWVLVALFMSIVIGSWVLKTEIVARGKGRIVSVGRTKSIQPQLRGKVVKVMVTDGQLVAKGDDLVILDPTEIESKITELNAELSKQKHEYALAKAVLHPLVSTDPAVSRFVEKGAEIYSNYVSTEIQGRIDDGKLLVQSILQALRSEVQEADAEVKQYSFALETQSARIEKSNADLKIVKERNASAKQLLSKGTISRVTYLERLRETQANGADLQIARKQLQEYHSQLDRVKKRRLRIISRAIADYRRALAEADTAIRGIEARLQASKNRYLNTRIISPVTGRIDDLQIFTTGGYVESGQKLMSIVPVDTKLEFEAFFENRDIGFLEPGQKTFIKLDAFPSERFGVVNGKVLTVGADARKLKKDSDDWVYAIQITPDRFFVEQDSKQLPFSPGMTGIVDVITGERRLISYFFEPIIKAIQDGFGER